MACTACVLHFSSCSSSSVGYTHCVLLDEPVRLLSDQFISTSDVDFRPFSEGKRRRRSVSLIYIWQNTATDDCSTAVISASPNHAGRYSAADKQSKQTVNKSTCWTQTMIDCTHTHTHTHTDRPIPNRIALISLDYSFQQRRSVRLKTFYIWK